MESCWTDVQDHRQDRQFIVVRVIMKGHMGL
jgi:hypothetical protein